MLLPRRAKGKERGDRDKGTEKAEGGGEAGRRKRRSFLLPSRLHPWPLPFPCLLSPYPFDERGPALSHPSAYNPPMNTQVSHPLAALLVATAVTAACQANQPARTPSDQAASATAQAGTFDVVIANGRVVDGTGAPWFRADVGITGDRITAIGNLTAAQRGDAHRRDRPCGGARLHRPARPVRVQRARGLARRQQDHAGHHDRDHRRGRLDRARERPDDGRPQGQLRRTSGSRRTSARSPSTSPGSRPVDAGDQRRHLRRLGRRARLRRRQGGSCRHRRGDRRG